MPDPRYAERLEQWKRFNEWEARELRDHPPDLDASIAWFWEVWQLARRHDASWGSMEAAEEHWRQIARVRGALAVLKG